MEGGDQLTEREISRKGAWRLATIGNARESGGNVPFPCRYYGVARPSYYKWLRRYEELGEEGLRDRSRRPLVCPHATKAAVVERIIYLRQNYHFGPFKIAMYLKRYHDISVTQYGVWRILRRLDLSRLPTSPPYTPTTH